MSDKKISGAAAEPRIDEIILPDGIKADYTAASPHNSLVGIKRLNAFVGPNNSGKSRLLRALFVTAQNLMVSSTEQHSVQIRSAVRSCIELLPAFERQRELVKDLAANLVAAPFGFHEGTQHFASFEKHLSEFSRVAQNLERVANDCRNHNPPPIDFDKTNQLCKSLRTICRGVEELAKESKPRYISGQQQPPIEPRLRNAKYIYIPTLRGMRLSSENESHLHAYFDRTWNDYFKGKKKWTHSDVESLEKARNEYHGKTILTGLDLYEWLTNKLLGGLNDRALVREYQEFLSRTFFQGVSVALIPRREHDTVHIKVGKEKERPVELLGDGLQQLIILTLPIFEHRNVPLFLFIEEPDLFLHPGYQRVFIDSVLSDKEREIYVFATTHSSQFLDITVSRDDCSVFRCEKQFCDEPGEELEPKFLVRNTTFGDSSLLKHIGVRPSSVMFANCTIWVEGVTDRLYFSRFVELVLRQRAHTYTENLHYAFVEYGGGNITHWSFLDEEGIDVDRLCARLLLIADHDSEKDERHQKLADKLRERFILLPVRESENLLTPEVIKGIIRSYEGEDVEHIESIDDLSDHARGIAEKICDFIAQENC